MQLNVNTDATLDLTARLERLHRSAFPSAVRNTLNEVAFNSKKLAPKKASEEMTIRQKNFIGRFTKVQKASGFNVKSMVSSVGISRENEQVTKGLSTQETGGSVKSRKLIPHNLGRVSGSYAKKLQAKNQFSRIGKIATPKKRIKGSKYVLIKKSGGKGTVFEIKNKKLKPIYTYRPTKISRLKPRPFISVSALESSKKIEFIYNKQAQFQFNKYMR